MRVCCVCVCVCYAQGPDSAYDPTNQEVAEPDSRASENRISVASGWSYSHFEVGAHTFRWCVMCCGDITPCIQPCRARFSTYVPCPYMRHKSIFALILFPFSLTVLSWAYICSLPFVVGGGDSWRAERRRNYLIVLRLVAFIAVFILSWSGYGIDDTSVSHAHS